ncbi:hypothetical protein SLEP1_g22189 [Rubroshorea leprosula]|uniref:Uncharacterized protein n=1 Tax=Rubroshorea leprosula TaxID=152421 RepID=A0AAV5J8E3_9ROSI|nr:hypothetical protein SLEP1_g22189 [Rubroshorea leprosula]
MFRLPAISVLVQWRPLKVYLSTFDKAMGALVAEIDQEGKEQLVYYVNQNCKDAESSTVQHPISNKVPGSEVTHTQEIKEEWTLYFDGSSTIEEARAGIVLRDDKGHDTQARKPSQADSTPLRKPKSRSALLCPSSCCSCRFVGANSFDFSIPLNFPALPAGFPNLQLRFLLAGILVLECFATRVVGLSSGFEVSKL